mmetsp:Transcript_17037/g.23839  ORF Transcript_17037/g.23839 Transcript_17037/m.23839 type:complete len:507 (-) Transcript_17037:218-1738(-)|eukprot:CAMPEP_0184487150 /NCGR_PEP_ID=MMETSP0113_2-20130426/9355_1 /TAXON_ID=91329 /ORGANISM="Norrisiella sphaerica, Strain BC52" /LENGTH=506 /DNA_ID=CAMNT_0026869347 /DNA_START=91 /DNA_END=1611 /DNA_ORIENTATION=+
MQYNFVSRFFALCALIATALSLVGTFVDTPFYWGQSHTSFDASQVAPTAKPDSTCDGTLTLGLAEFKNEYSCTGGAQGNSKEYFLTDQCSDVFKETTCEVCSVGGLLTVGMLFVSFLLSIVTCLKVGKTEEDEEEEGKRVVAALTMTFFSFLLTGGGFAVWWVTCREELNEEFSTLENNGSVGFSIIEFDWGALLAMIASVANFLAFCSEFVLARGNLFLRCSIHKFISVTIVLLASIGAIGGVMGGSFATRLAWSDARVSIDSEASTIFKDSQDCKIDYVLGLAEIRQKITCADSPPDNVERDVDVYYWQNSCADIILGTADTDTKKLCETCEISGFAGIAGMSAAAILGTVALLKSMFQEYSKWNRAANTGLLFVMALLSAGSLTQWLLLCNEELKTYVSDLGMSPSYSNDPVELAIGIFIAIGVAALALLGLIFEGFRELDADRDERIEKEREEGIRQREAAKLTNIKTEGGSGDKPEVQGQDTREASQVEEVKRFDDKVDNI